MFMKALEKEGVKSFSRQLSLADVARFEYFRNGPGRKFGVWVVRQGNIHFELPFVTGRRLQHPIMSRRLMDFLVSLCLWRRSTRAWFPFSSWKMADHRSGGRRGCD